ncbi:MAG TPA: hypothetical protein DIW05_08975 [Syntrophaceae bacterium]|nr:hypothetical protein [Syntrophaceae bacterium]
MIGRKGFQINQLAFHGKIACFQCLHDSIQIGLFIVKNDQQDIRLLCLMLFDAVNFLQDSPYPSVRASRKTSRNSQLNNPFLGAGRIHQSCQKNEY